MIRLGYEIGSGRAVDVPLAHIAVTGQTQQSGKTTTLEALVHRSKLRAIAFITKRAEGSFRDARTIPPYFRDRADWQFVSALMESIIGEKLKFERSWIIDACSGAESLADVQANVQSKLYGIREPIVAGKRHSKKREWRIKPATGLSQGVLTNLAAYLEIVLPQIEKLPYTDALDLQPGLNVMDLSAYTTELQSLVVRSVLEWVYEKQTNTAVIIPEAWEFIPQNRRSPVLLAAEELIRKGAALGNFVWLDSQDIAAVHKNVLRSVGVWILGVQREFNEIKRTLNHIPNPKPQASELMNLPRGEFFACFSKDRGYVCKRVYVQPFWIGEEHARSVAMKEVGIETVEAIWKERADRRREVANEITNEKAPKPERESVTSRDSSRGGRVPDSIGSGPEMDKACTSDSMRTDESGGGLPTVGADYVENAEETENAEMNVTDTKEYRELSTQYREHVERYDALFAENAKLRGEVSALRAELLQLKGGTPNPKVPSEIQRDPTHPRPAAVAVPGSFDGLYFELRDRLLADPEAQAAVVQLILARPEINVTVQRTKLSMNGDSIQGRLARLLLDNYFKEPRPGTAVKKELARRWAYETPTTNIYTALNKLADLGFITKEDEGYKAVEGMLVNVTES